MAEADAGSIIEREKRRVRRVLWLVWGANIAAWCVTGAGGTGRHFDARFWTVLLGACSLMLVVQWAGARALGRSARALDAADDPRAIGPLLNLYCGTGWFRCRAAEPALARRLRAARCSGSARLGSDQIAQLRQALALEGSWPFRGRRMSPALTLAALDAIAASDPHQAMRTLRQFTHARVPAEVRHAAERVLARLERREREAERANRLLRPAAAPGGADTLLRPAHGAPSAEDDALLRPAELHVDKGTHDE